MITYLSDQQGRGRADIEVIQPGSRNYPRVTFDSEEDLLNVSGRSIAERPELVYGPLEEWLKTHMAKYNRLNIVIYLEYINSGSSKALRDLLRIAGSYMPPQYRMKITWLYEEDDEAMHELGEHYRDAAGVPMEVKMIL